SHTSTLPTYLLSFFFNDTATTDIYTLSLHDALPISHDGRQLGRQLDASGDPVLAQFPTQRPQRRPGHLVDVDRLLFAIDLAEQRSEEHTSELQSLTNLVCRLLLEKKKT